MRLRNIGAVAAMAALLAFAGCARKQEDTAKAAAAEMSAPSDILPKSATGYYAFYMATNNIVLYGKVSKFGEDFVHLNDVHYIRTNIDQKTKEVTNSIIRRGAEWHKPDETLISAEQILFVEPVAADSRVMVLIRDLKTK